MNRTPWWSSLAGGTPVTGCTIRSATGDDLPFLRHMLLAAALWRPEQDATPTEEALALLEHPDLAVYVEGWGRDGDLGVVAIVDRAPVGAAWIRCFTPEQHGYGFVDEATPELTVAVSTDHRRRGIGRGLLRRLLADAAVAGHDRISLSVESDNPAVELYRSVGFRTVTTGDALTMVAPASDRATG